MSTRTINSKKLKPSEYSVGWISALPQTEYVAAELMLDEKYPPTVTEVSNDGNTYTFGRIEGHSVVIACLPVGVTGEGAAARVAVQMRNTFRNIRLAIMAGIGGAVPSQKHDIRLGDVVVSIPGGRLSGVIQWDRGKITTGGMETTGSLNNPPESLLMAISTLMKNTELGELDLLQHFDHVRTTRPRLKRTFTSNENLTDVLYEANCLHTEPPTILTPGSNSRAPDPSKKTCDQLGCHSTLDTVNRNAREPNFGPQIHYGLIASGNSVIKSGIDRDDIAKRFNEEILCFEMEAAGMMNTLPMIVIRGISDYADSHKNDDWQPYAAFAAAAYAKEILKAVRPEVVEEIKPGQ